MSPGRTVPDLGRPRRSRRRSSRPGARIVGLVLAALLVPFALVLTMAAPANAETCLAGVGREGLHRRHHPDREGRRPRRRRHVDGPDGFDETATTDDGASGASRSPSPATTPRRSTRRPCLTARVTGVDGSATRCPITNLAQAAGRTFGVRTGDYSDTVSSCRPDHPQHLQRHAARPAPGAGLHRPVPDLRHDRPVQLRPRRAGDPGRHARLPGRQPVGRQPVARLRAGRGARCARSPATPRTEASGSRCDGAVSAWRR